MYKPHSCCRACGYAFHGAGGNRNPNERLMSVLNLGVQPLANDFCKQGQERQGYAPLEVLFCERCGLAQLSVVVKPEVLYKNYAYVTSDSETMKKHFASLVKDLTAEQPAGSVVEIGSNNGALLKYLRQYGFNPVIGIEPAENLANEANKEGILTVNDFLNEECAKDVRLHIGQVSFVLARHCFCHVDDWHQFVAALEVLADKDTLIAIEVPYLPDQIANVSFDQCYHEHTSYLSLKAMAALLADTSLMMHKVVKYPIHGGCVLVMLRKKLNGRQPHESVAEFSEQEKITADTWREFAAEAHAQIHKLRLLVKSLRESGKTVCGYGASAKSTVWLNACGFTKKDIAFVTDTTMGKWNTLCPGTDIPVTDPGALMRELPNYAIMFAWNFRDEILEKEALYRSNGGRFIVPVPHIKILG
jgi:novobiocin biosynthesis protein NovU/D-mycarose 3-C-methyltransferase